jgi:hypothetical protein
LIAVNANPVVFVIGQVAARGKLGTTVTFDKKSTPAATYTVAGGGVGRAKFVLLDERLAIEIPTALSVRPPESARVARFNAVQTDQH